MDKHSFLAVLAITLIIFLLVGCNSTPAEMSPTPDPSIVWSDDFEDGDTEGWEEEGEIGDEFTVVDGQLSFYDYGYIAHPSSVSNGTWTADVFIPDVDEGFIIINFMTKGIMGDEPSGWRNLGIVIEHQPSTTIKFGYWDGSKANIIKTETISEGERLTGWQHVDITRDEGGFVKAYINKELVLESSFDYPFEPNYFHYLSCCEGPALDNVVVRNQVIDIQPAE